MEELKKNGLIGKICETKTVSNAKHCEPSNSRNSAGITLVALVVSIVVMLILAGVSINAVVGDNGILTQAQSASLATTYANYLEDLQLGIVLSGDTPTCVGSTMQSWISSMKDEDLENFMILKGELYYIGNDDTAKSAAENVGISTDLSGGSATDVITITENIVFIDDEDSYVGTKLLDKNALNSETWNLAIDYNGSNKEVARYGTGYYLLEPNVEYTITNSDGEEETVTFSDYYVINYSTNSLIGTNNIKVWNIKSTVAVTEGLVLNIDPTNMADIDYVETTVTDDAVAGEGVEATAYQLYVDGEDTGITKYGDVEYDSTNSALVFNESDDNVLITEDGDTAGGGYLKLIKDDDSIDFSDGFSFEIYANLSRLYYNNGYSNYIMGGLFCRLPNLGSDRFSALRSFFSMHSGCTYALCKFYSSSSWVGTGSGLFVDGDANVRCTQNYNFTTNEDFYMTLVYTVYDVNTADDYQLSYYTEYGEMIDKVSYYLNGELEGYCYYGHTSFESGLTGWNDSACPFFLGVCPWASDTNFYYLKGSVYTTRLYTCSMTEDEVEENYNATLQYRESFT